MGESPLARPRVLVTLTTGYTPEKENDMETTTKKPIERMTETEVLEHLEKARQLTPRLATFVTLESFEELLRALEGWIGRRNE